MSTPARKNTNEWREECRYISATTDAVLAPHWKRHALASFNNDRSCFVRYCEMQRDDATRCGFRDSAQYIQHCIDDLTS